MGRALGRSGGSPVQPREPEPARLPPGYLKDGYFGEDGALKEALIRDHPFAIAKAFAQIRLTAGQTRRFYHHVRQAARRLGQGESFQAVRPAILELSPLVADAVGRAKGTGQADYELFKQFIDANVDAAAGSRDAFERGFVPHFQYVVAYFTYLKPRG